MPVASSDRVRRATAWCCFSALRAVVALVCAAVIARAGAADTIAFAQSAVVGDAGSTVVLSVVRSGALTGTATVQYATSDLTAHAGTDYVTSAGVLSFGDGEATQQITVQLLDPADGADGRSLQVALSAPSNATLASPMTATVTTQRSTTGGTTPAAGASRSADDKRGGCGRGVAAPAAAAVALLLRLRRRDQPMR